MDHREMNDYELDEPRPRATPRGRRLLTAAAWVAVGLVLGFLAFRDPLGLWSPHSEHETAAVAEEGQLYTCPMHPDVILEQPGECPICGMTLVPVSEVEAEAGRASGATSRKGGEREVLFYRNPMNPTITSPVPMKDEMGMDYVPVYADEAEGAGGPAGDGTVVRIDPAVVQNMNVTTTRVERRDLRHPIRTVGYLEYDQERMVSVTTKYTGWVEKVYVNYLGEPVRRGEPLFEVYSPELVQTEQELLSALDFAQRMQGAPGDQRRRAEALVDAARTRLSYWDISDRQVDRLVETGEVFRTLTVTAPASGLVMKRMPGLEGMAVEPGMEVYHIADISRLWLSVEVFEENVAWIGVGTPAKVNLTYFPGQVLRGKVRFVEPEFDERTRTLRVTLEIPNPELELRAGMFATVVFEPRAVEDALAVPTLAVLRTGQRNLVIVEVGEGRFAPREVVLGHTGEGYAEVLEGLEEGETVVTSSQFLIDSEATLQEAIQKMIAARRKEKS